MQMKVKTLSVIVGVMFLVLLSYAVLAQAAPQGPGTVQRGTPDRRTTGIDTTAGTLVQAQAGNVTALNINSTRLTSRWQGYYGNVSGVITLDDASNNTLYNWQLASPQGEIYAVNQSTTPTWANVKCFNFTDTSQNVTLANLESSIGAATTDKDGVNETFNLTYSGSFSAGTKTIVAGDQCPIASLFASDAWTGVSFNETVLFQNQSNDMVIYVALLEQDRIGFSGSTLDFEMIVGENGDSVAATNYYFFVELT